MRIGREWLAARARRAHDRATDGVQERGPEPAPSPEVTPGPDLEPEPSAEPEPDAPSEEPVPSTPRIALVAAGDAGATASERGNDAAEPGGGHSSQVVALSARAHGPRAWNLWDLERLAKESSGADVARDEERSYLLMYLRDFATADGILPPDFDAVVRESFGDVLDAVHS